jgi:hypothetical protein
MGEIRIADKISVSKPEGKRDCVEDLGVDERIILKWILYKWGSAQDRIQ